MCKIVIQKARHGSFVIPTKHCATVEDEFQLMELEKLAIDHYNTWGHWFVECYGKREWYEFIYQCRSEGVNPKVEMLRIGTLKQNHMEDIQKA